MAQITIPELTFSGLESWITNSDGWSVLVEDGESVLALPENRSQDWRHGAVAIAGDSSWRDYEFSLELLVLPPHRQGAGAWPGIIFRARDTENYELFWVIPDALESNAVYLSVAHGLVPWWADAYANNPRGSIPFRRGEWLRLRVRVEGLGAYLFVGDATEPALSMRLTYYLQSGAVGLYCGTETSAKFRRFAIRHLEPAPIPDPPENPQPRLGRVIEG